MTKPAEWETFATKRETPWVFVGWIKREPRGPNEQTFEEVVRENLKCEHGKSREVDLYTEGAVFWYKKP